MSTLERAIEISARAHAGQTEERGTPYVLHPLRLMSRFSGASQKHQEHQIVAVLHEVVEDCGVELGTLRTAGFPESIIAALDALTRRTEEAYVDYLKRAVSDPIARRMKPADLEDHADLSRLPDPTEAERQQSEEFLLKLEVFRQIAALSCA